MTVETFEPGAYAEIETASSLERKVLSAYPMAADDVMYCGLKCAGEWPRYLCTRPEGHAGPHVAHIDTDTACAWWPNEGAK